MGSIKRTSVFDFCWCACPPSQKPRLGYHLHFGANGATMAPCLAYRLKTSPKTPTESCGSEPREHISPCRNTFGVVSSPTPINPRWMRFSIALRLAMVAGCPLARPSVMFGQNVIVVDASVLAVALGDDGTDGQRARERLADETLAAPELVDLEVVSVWRRQVVAKLMPAQRAAGAVGDLADLPLHRSSHRPLLSRIWKLRHVVTPYDAAYVALAEALDVVLVTADARLSRASGVKCEIEAIGAAGRS
jgi:predicted nucleic acid-binding protein